MREVLLWVLLWIFVCISGYLSVKLYLVRKTAEEIREGFGQKLAAETNTLLTVSSRDKQMRRLAEDINTQLRVLSAQRHLFRQGDRELKESVANLSHDIRTPLTAVCGYLELLEESLRHICGDHCGTGPDAVEGCTAQDMEMQEAEWKNVERYLCMIGNRVEVLKNMTEELFQYSNIMSAVEADSKEKKTEQIILNHVLEENISAYYAVLKAKRIEPVVQMPEKKIICYGDKNAVSRIFENVLSNAVKYSEGDLQITLSEDGEITFSNHASSLDEMQAGRLFERFYTVDTARKSTGLGLSIAKRLTERMGGSIDAQYREGVLCIRIRPGSGILSKSFPD